MFKCVIFAENANLYRLVAARLFSCLFYVYVYRTLKSRYKNLIFGIIFIFFVVFAMNAITVYVNAAKLVLQITDSNWSGIQDLYRILPQLRQLLACAVCCRLVNDPYVPRHGRCHHNVCRVCVRGQKKLQPLCNYCKDNRDYKCYNENKQMRCLLLCYKGLCDHLKSSSIYQQLMNANGNNNSVRKLQTTYNILLSNITNINGSIPQTLHDLIVEGTTYDEVIINSNNNNNNNNAFNNGADIQQTTKIVTNNVLTKVSQLPALVSPLSTTAAVTPLPPPATLPVAYQNASTPPTTANNNLGETLALTKIKTEQYSPPLVIAQQKQVQHQQTQQMQQQQHQHAPPLQILTTVSPTISTSTSTQSQPALIQLSQVQKNSNTNSVTYIGTNARGIVVPIVSSSVTTTAPLTIASARLQSLNRQLAQARIINTTSASLLSPSSSSITSSTSSTRNTMELKSNTTIGTTYKVSLATNANTVQLTKTIAGLSNNNSNSNRMNTLNTKVCATPIRNPPPIKTVSNGSAMYSVLYTGIGNKITIKRKTDSDEDANQKKATAAITTKTTISISAPVTTTTTTTSSLSLSSSLPSTKMSLPIESTAVRTTSPLQKTLNKNNTNKRRGCRCGNATPTPGKLTCCGQRCPCYVESKSCIGCKCRGCRNPHRPGGGKVRPIIPELACYEIQMADEHSNPLGESHDIPLTSNTIQNRNVSVASSGLNFSNIKGCISTTTATSCSTNVGNGNDILPTITSNKTGATISTNILGYCNTNNKTPPPLAPATTINIHKNNHQSHQHNHNVTHNANNTTTIQSNATTNILQLEHLPRESVLVQNAQGKYQVLNLFTSSSSSPASSMAGTQMVNGAQPVPTLQRIQQSLSKVVGSGGPSTTFPSNSYILNTTASANANVNGSGTSTVISTSNSNPTLSQIILQAKQQQLQQQQLLTKVTTTAQRNLINSNSTNNNNNISTITAGSPLTIPLQLQQQLKQNVITVHTINNPMNSIANHLSNHTTSILTLTSNATPMHTTPTVSSTLTGIANELRPIGATTNLYTNAINQNNNNNSNNNAILNISSGPTTIISPTIATTINNRNCIMANVTSNHHQNVTRTIRTAGIIDIFDGITKTSNQ